jgi:zinc transport system substrate-binding protein
MNDTTHAVVPFSRRCRRGLISLVKIAAFAAIAIPALFSSVNAEALHVAVSILPQAYFVKKIGADFVSVTVLVPPGANPATYEPKPTQMVSISKSKVYFSIGVPFEQAWLPKFSSINPAMKMVHTDAGIRKIPMNPAHHHGASGHQVEKDSRGMLDPHIWLSPPLVKIQAEHILDGLRQSDPIHAEIYETNFRRFSEEIDRLDADLHRLFSGLGRVRFLVFHPSWGYFAETYGLEQIPIEFEGKDPKPAALQALIKEAISDGIKVVFVQPQFSMKSAETISNAIGGEVMIADPLAQDWEANLRRQAIKIKSALN